MVVLYSPREPVLGRRPLVVGGERWWPTVSPDGRWTFNGDVWVRARPLLAWPFWLRVGLGTWLAYLLLWPPLLVVLTIGQGSGGFVSATLGGWTMRLSRLRVR